jgi:hypothetical protein
MKNIKNLCLFAMLAGFSVHASAVAIVAAGFRQAPTESECNYNFCQKGEMKAKGEGFCEGRVCYCDCKVKKKMGQYDAFFNRLRKK